MFSAYVFDAYGTLFDVHAAVRWHAAAIGPDGAALSELWRQKQLEYSWVRGLAGRYRDFWALTEDALDFALARFPAVDRSVRPSLLEAYRALEAYSEVTEVLGALKQRGAHLAILSNGSPEMLEAAVGSSGLDALLDAVLSVDALATFKTNPRTYALVTERFGVTAEAVSFQSSNRWDIAGATAFGFRTVWINRSGQPDEYLDLPPAKAVGDLRGLLSDPAG